MGPFPDVLILMSILNEKGTKVEGKASVSSIQVNLAAELIDVLPDRQEGWISHSAAPLHMQPRLGRRRRRNVWPLCRGVNVSFDGQFYQREACIKILDRI